MNTPFILGQTNLYYILYRYIYLYIGEKITHKICFWLIINAKTPPFTHGIYRLCSSLIFNRRYSFLYKVVSCCRWYKDDCIKRILTVFLCLLCIVCVSLCVLCIVCIMYCVCILHWFVVIIQGPCHENTVWMVGTSCSTQPAYNHFLSQYNKDKCVL